MRTEDFHWWQDMKTALSNGDTLVLTGYKVLPRDGGLQDQDWFEWEDIKTYLRLYHYAWRENHPKEGNPRTSDPLNFEREGAVTEIDDFIN